MILSSLLAYHRRGVREGWIPPLGLVGAKVDVLVDLDADGQVLAVLDVREPQGKAGRLQGAPVVAPAEPSRSSNIAARLLLDRPDYVLGVPENAGGEPTPRALAQAERAHAAFVEAHLQWLPTVRAEGAEALRAALAAGRLREQALALCNEELQVLLGKKATRVSFRAEVDGLMQPLLSLPALREAAGAAAAGDARDVAGQGRCLVTGREAAIARIHPKVSVRGARGALVSFQADAFCAHGLSQGQNAPVAREVALAYAAALQVLAAKDSNCLREGETTYLWWGESATDLEAAMGQALGEGWDDWQEEERGEAAIEQALGTLRGAAAEADAQASAPFAVLGLSGREGRLVTRVWRRGTAGELAADLGAFREDLAMVEGGRRIVPSLQALVHRLIGAEDNRANHSARERLFAALLPAALERTRALPPALLYFALQALRPGGSRAEERGWERQVGACATAAKAYINRGVATRTLPGHKELDMSLDPQNNRAPYLLGRLFAVQERVQECSFRQEGRDPGAAGLRARYFNLAMSSPALALAQAAPLINVYLDKLRRSGPGIGVATALGQQLDDITDGLPARLPALLTPSERGEFIVGYHHQRQHHRQQRSRDKAA